NTILQRAAIMSRAMQIESNALQIAGLEPLPENQPLQLGVRSMQLDDVEQVLIRKALLKYNGNVSRTATALGISRGTLYNKMRKYGLAYSESDSVTTR
ncbi:MAG TPA: helix-turn-helix domain-containing protein, partial [bacterium]|nr:helix-turn-helix domain-containing protein [bacterium]